MKFIILLFFLSACSGSSSQNRSVSSLSNLNDAFDIPGIAGAIYKDNSFSEMRTNGVRKSGTESLLEVTDKFHLGSCTKAMTATIAALMIEEGKLSWTSKMSDLLPEIQLHSQYANMSFETLLVHRAGLPFEHSLFNEVKGMNPVNGRELITKRLLATAPLTTPEKKYAYSNYSYIIAGHILERISGSSWETLMRKYIFDPLGMESCGFGVTSIADEIFPTTNWGHIKKNGIITPRHYDNPSAFGPASTVHCSLSDWGKFLEIHLHGFNGEGNFLRPETFKKLYSVHPSKDSSYTYGGRHLLQRTWANGPTLSHTGSNTFNYAKVWIAPKRKAFILSAANIGGNDAFLATDAFIQELTIKHLY